MDILKKVALGVAALVGVSALGACSLADATGESPEASGSVQVTDVMGRTVSFEKQPERIILGEGRGIFATSIIDSEHPTDKVVAMGDDIKSAAPSFLEKLQESHPEVKDIPTIGSLAKGDVSVETLLSYQPDVITITADHYKAAKDTGLLDKMDRAGLKYVVTDFRIHPLQNTTTSVGVYGKILGKPEKAEEFNKEWQSSVDKIAQKTKDVNKPGVFVWRAGGFGDCCSTVKESNIGEFVAVAGGNNLGDAMLTTESGSVTPEKLIQEQPEKILVTGGSWAPKNGKPTQHVNLGYTSTPDAAQTSLKNLNRLPGMDKVDALGNGQTVAIWHQFYDSPLNFIAIEYIAHWLHPDLFPEVDTQKHWQEVHKKYVPFDAAGVFFADSSK